MYFRGFVCYWVGNLGTICIGELHVNFRLLISTAWQTVTKTRPPLVYYYPNITALAKVPSYSAPYIARGTVQQPEDSEWIIFGDTSLILSVKYSAVPPELPHYCCLATQVLERTPEAQSPCPAVQLCTPITALLHRYI